MSFVRFQLDDLSTLPLENVRKDNLHSPTMQVLQLYVFLANISKILRLPPSRSTNVTVLLIIRAKLISTQILAAFLDRINR